MKVNVFDRLITFLQDLEKAKISYTLGYYRDDGITVSLAVPGARWEVEFLQDGAVEVEKFVSNGDISGPEILNYLLAEYTDLAKPENTEHLVMV